MIKYQTFFRALAEIIDYQIGNNTLTLTDCRAIAKEAGVENPHLVSIPELYEFCYEYFENTDLISTKKVAQHKFSIGAVYVVFYKIVTFLAANEQEIPIARKGELWVNGETMLSEFDVSLEYEEALNDDNAIQRIAASWEHDDNFCECKTVGQVYNYVRKYINNNGTSEQVFFTEVCRMFVAVRKLPTTQENLGIAANFILMQYLAYITRQSSKGLGIATFSNYVRNNQSAWFDVAVHKDAMHNEAIVSFVIKSFKNLAIKGK